MKQHLLAALLVGAAFAVAIPATAFAQSEELEEADAGRAAKAKPDDRFCVKETGSRVIATRNKSKKSDDDCVSSSGRVYTREDIERTGSVDLKDALRRLDPSIR